MPAQWGTIQLDRRGAKGTRVESAEGAVALGEGVAVAGGFRLGAGASLLAIAPFPPPLIEPDVRDLPHPALGRASRKSIHRASPQACLVEVNQSYLAVDLGVAETAGSADAEFMPPAEEPPDLFPDMPANSFIDLACMAETEALGPAQQKRFSRVHSSARAKRLLSARRICWYLFGWGGMLGLGQPATEEEHAATMHPKPTDLQLPA